VTREPKPSNPPDSDDPPVPGPRHFLDVSWLLSASEPRRPLPRLWFFLGGLFSIMMLSAMMSGASGATRGVAEGLLGLLMAALMAGLLVASHMLVRRLRAEQQLVEGIGELLQLRRWTEAAGQLDTFLGAPTRTQAMRVEALRYLGVVLARYQRYDDAVTVYDYLLDREAVDAGAAYGLRLGRAMAMLREDRLVDADRAISELRRLPPSQLDPAGLGLLELYRDVKTGHADDAVVRFEKLLPAFRKHLGHRSADAWALVARAYDLLGRPADAKRAFHNATLLAPPVELFRRYPEVKKLDGKYDPAYAPADAA
jgi:tetratricopeptide (TPR) repeat protein